MVAKKRPIKMETMEKFMEAFSMGYTREMIMEYCGIKAPTYYRYVEQAERMKEDYLMGLAEHGIVLRHRSHLNNTVRRLNYLNKVLEAEHEKIDKGESVDKWFYLRAVSQANETESLAVKLLSDANIVRGIEQLFIKLSMKGAKEKGT